MHTVCELLTSVKAHNLKTNALFFMTRGFKLTFLFQHCWKLCYWTWFVRWNLFCKKFHTNTSNGLQFVSLTNAFRPCFLFKVFCCARIYTKRTKEEKKPSDKDTLVFCWNFTHQYRNFIYSHLSSRFSSYIICLFCQDDEWVFLPYTLSTFGICVSHQRDAQCILQDVLAYCCVCFGSDRGSRGHQKHTFQYSWCTHTKRYLDMDLLILMFCQY